MRRIVYDEVAGITSPGSVLRGVSSHFANDNLLSDDKPGKQGWEPGKLSTKSQETPIRSHYRRIYDAIRQYMDGITCTLGALL